MFISVDRTTMQIFIRNNSRLQRTSNILTDVDVITSLNEFRDGSDL